MNPNLTPHLKVRPVAFSNRLWRRAKEEAGRWIQKVPVSWVAIGFGSKRLHLPDRPDGGQHAGLERTAGLSGDVKERRFSPKKTNLLLAAILSGRTSMALLGVGLMLQACSPQKQEPSAKKYAVWMMDSEMARFPELWVLDDVPIPFWGYTHGIIAKASLDVYAATGDQQYGQYALDYADTLIGPAGLIVTYDSSKHNIDMINPGKILFPLYEMTGDKKYLEAATTLREAMRNHPQTKEGGYWHKKRYTHQMWLDGLYMGAPFLAQYAQVMNEEELFDVVATQFRLIDQYTYDPETSLYYHGWDESRSMLWADSVTGTSPNFWGRSVGWLAMALVDVLDYFPESHPDRGVIMEVLAKTARGIKRHQDAATGVWYQVMDQGQREGNYLEATASSMFVYALYKAVRKGYLEEAYLEVASRGYQGILEQFIRENADGTISLTRCCAVAGLGGKNNRDGSFDYYISEPIRSDDPKGVGPFIWASMEYERLNEPPK